MNGVIGFEAQPGDFAGRAQPRFVGNPYAQGGQSVAFDGIPMGQGDFFGVADAALAFAKDGRRDAVDRWRKDQDEANFPAMMRAKHGARADSDFSPGGGLFFPRELEFVYPKVLEEKRPQPNGLRLFPLDTQVPVGARTHNVRRMLQTGEAKIHRGSSVDVPRADINAIEETFPIRHIVTGIAVNLFELQSAGYANVPIIEGKVRAARRVYEALLNQLIWYGSAADGLYGILNYPRISQRVAAVAFDGSASADSVIIAWNSYANFANNASLQTFYANRCATSPRVRAMMFGVPRSTNSDKTIGQYVIENHPRIKSIDECWELQGVGPGGTDGMIFWNDESDDSVAIVIPQGLTALPVQFRMFEQFTPMFSSYGGVVMRDVGNNSVVWVTPPSN